MQCTTYKTQGKLRSVVVRGSQADGLKKMKEPESYAENHTRGLIREENGVRLEFYRKAFIY